MLHLNLNHYLSLTKIRSLVGEEIPARQQGAVQQGGAEAGSLEQVHGAGEEGKGELSEIYHYYIVIRIRKIYLI